MKIMVVSGIYSSNKKGLYFAVMNRIVAMKNKGVEVEHINIISNDNVISRIIKGIFKRDTLKESSEMVGDQEISYDSMLNFLLKFPIVDMFIYKHIYRKVKLKSSDFDYIFVHWTFPHIMITEMLSSYYNKQYAVFCHGSDINYMYKKGRKIKLTIEKCLNKAFGIFYVSESLMKNANNVFELTNKNQIVTQNGVDTNTFRKYPKDLNRRLKNSLGIKKDSKVIGYLGNLTHSKGADLLPDIIKTTLKNNKGYDITFIIIGNGAYINDIKERLVNYQNNVIIIDSVEQQKVPAYLNIMDTIIVPSRFEGFGLICIEALACETNCIVSDIGTFREILGGPNVFFSSNINEFVVNIDKAINTPFEKNYYERILKHYDINKIVEDELNFVSKK